MNFKLLTTLAMILIATPFCNAQSSADDWQTHWQSSGFSMVAGTDEDLVYAIGPDGIYYSENYGRSWILAEEGSYGDRIFSSGPNIIILNEWRSLDGGSSWTQVEGLEDLTTFPEFFTRGIGIAGWDELVVKTTDTAGVWEVVLDLDSFGATVNGVVVFDDQEALVYGETDGGDGFTLLTEDRGETWGDTAMHPDPVLSGATDGEMYIIAGRNGFMAESQTGVLWEDVDTEFDSDILRLQYTESGAGMAIVDNQDDLTYDLYYADLFNDWTYVDLGRDFDYNGDLQLFVADNLFLAVQEARIARSLYAGSEWDITGWLDVDASGPLKLDFFDDYVGIGVNGGTNFFWTIDGGNNWIREVDYFDDFVNRVHCLGEDEALMTQYAGSSFEIYKSDDQADSWELVYEDLGTATIFKQAGDIVSLNWEGNVFASDDRGETWFDTVITSGFYPISLAKAGSDYFGATKFDSSYQVSTDLENWTPVLTLGYNAFNSGWASRPLSVHFANADDGLFVAEVSLDAGFPEMETYLAAIITDDGGSTFYEPQGLNNMGSALMGWDFYERVEFSDEDVFYLANENEYYLSLNRAYVNASDQTATEVVLSFFSNPIYGFAESDISINGTLGHFVNPVSEQITFDVTQLEFDEETGGPGGGTDPESVGEIEIGTYTSLFPNPATDRVIIPFAYSKRAPFTIYNINGMVVKKGITQGTIAVDDLSTGMYMVELEVEGETKLAKFVK